MQTVSSPCKVAQICAAAASSIIRHAPGPPGSAGATAERYDTSACRARGRPADPLRQMRGRDVPDARGLAVSGVRIQDRLLRLVT
jgi:hypothetical protein